MATDIVIFVDCQNDFFYGSLGSAAARSIIPNLIERAKAAEENGEKIVFTYDTHNKEDYLTTLEGEFFPSHCLYISEGWDIIKELAPFVDMPTSCNYVKETFGIYNLGDKLITSYRDGINKITLLGVTTDICVISNVLILRSFFPNTEICVDASCCAGTTIEKHNAALKVMESCLVTIENREEEK